MGWIARRRLEKAHAEAVVDFAWFAASQEVAYFESNLDAASLLNMWRNEGGVHSERTTDDGWPVVIREAPESGHFIKAVAAPGHVLASRIVFQTVGPGPGVLEVELLAMLTSFMSKIDEADPGWRRQA